MSNHRKRWSASEKLEIINYFKQQGVLKTTQEYGVSSTSIYKWTAAYEESGDSGLSSSKSSREMSKMEQEELRRLRRENDELKKLVAEKELRLRIKEALLKKSR